MGNGTTLATLSVSMVVKKDGMIHCRRSGPVGFVRDQPRRLLCHAPEVDQDIRDRQLLFAFERHEQMTQLLGVAVDGEAGLAHGGEPDVVEADCEVVMFVVRRSCCHDKPSVSPADVAIAEFFGG
ncbi:hypothetical protein PG994_009375 [Apiospora phragmitis]|uniref:Uncharacterized protein n=1 Tax=Apiospora phragmitis TaxID=2905665 RepID=A0ABR1UJN4_9PEZI